MLKSQKKNLNNIIHIKIYYLRAYQDFVCVSSLYLPKRFNLIKTETHTGSLEDILIPISNVMDIGTVRLILDTLCGESTSSGYSPSLLGLSWLYYVYCDSAKKFTQIFISKFTIESY